MLKQGLNTKLSQSLSMTPQMQQAIRLLQLSSLELEQEIQAALDSNPLLEMAVPETETDSAVSSNDTENGASSENAQEAGAQEKTAEQANPDEQYEIPSELEMDATWDDVFDTSNDYSTLTSSAAEDSTTTILEKTSHKAESLHDHLNWQIHLSQLSNNDKLIARHIINAIDPHGFLQESVENLHQQLLIQDLIPELEEDEVLSVLNYVQRLDPIGVGARSLSECLAIQLVALYPDDPILYKTGKIIIQQPKLLDPKHHNELKHVAGLSSKTFAYFLHSLKQLNPRPGSDFAEDDTEYVEPDVYVKKINGEWQVSLNANMAHSLKINDYYADLLTEKGQKNDIKYLKDNLKQANWFIHSLENRNQTILKVSKAIVEQQTAFLQYGDQAMKPMILKDIAEKLDMHESSISRATAHKYIHTPKGIYELKHFFSSQVSTETGSQCSSTAIQAMISQFIHNENERKPLSDNKLTQLLQEQGINVARRTVTKYREALHIPSSHDRKVIA